MKTTSCRSLLLAALAGALLATVSASAQLVGISNFAEPYFVSDGLTATHWEDQAFITGSDWTTSLFSIAIRDSAVSSPAYIAQLFLGTPDSGTLVTNLALASDVGGVATFLPSTTVTLNANTTYWFSLGLTSGTVSWDAANTYNVTGSGTFPAEPDTVWGYSDNAGTTWTQVSHSGSLPQYIEVKTALIPEPASYSLALGALALGLYLYRRSQTA